MGGILLMNILPIKKILADCVTFYNIVKDCKEAGPKVAVALFELRQEVLHLILKPLHHLISRMCGLIYLCICIF